MNFIDRLKSYIKESINELRKVTWLSRPEVIKYTAVVIFISLGTAVFLGGLDLGFNKLLIGYLLK